MITCRKAASSSSSRMPSHPVPSPSSNISFLPVLLHVGENSESHVVQGRRGNSIGVPPASSRAPRMFSSSSRAPCKPGKYKYIIYIIYVYVYNICLTQELRRRACMYDAGLDEKFQNIVYRYEVLTYDIWCSTEHRWAIYTHRPGSSLGEENLRQSRQRFESPKKDFLLRWYPCLSCITRPKRGWKQLVIYA